MAAGVTTELSSDKLDKLAASETIETDVAKGSITMFQVKPGEQVQCRLDGGVDDTRTVIAEIVSILEADEPSKVKLTLRKSA